ncbi:MAG: nicotinate phosphoribosyltransferase [Bacillota bacterium]|nr:nicotinate phosphoribosyltransferase [Bacillota bacterium]
MSDENMSMLCDFYEFTMGNGYLLSGLKDKISYFDLYFRNVPDGGGYAIAAGLEQLVHYIQNLKFTPDDIAYMESKQIFSKEFIDYLRDFRFTGDIYAVPEGTPVFPNEPLVIVRAPAIEAQIIETAALLCINHQSLIATKANRIVRTAQGRPVLEFGARRAQGKSGATIGARAAYIGGCTGTSNALTDQLFGVPALGTMAHSWVMMFDNEYEAFAAYCKQYPNSATLLVDTYDTIKSGVPNAIRAIKEFVLPVGGTNYGIRLDSGDIAYLSKKARKMLDEAGLPDCKIVASNSLDEYLIRDLLLQGAEVDFFGVGERLITSKSAPVFGGVYKLVATENPDGELVPKIKISGNIDKITTPHFKKVFRLFDRDTGKALADQICVHDETIDDSKPLEIFHPMATWKRKLITNFRAKELLVPIFRGGELVYQLPTIHEIKQYCREQVDLLWDEVKRFEYPHKYYVDLSQKLWDIKDRLLKSSR